MSEHSIFKRKGRKGVTLQYRDLAGKLKQRSFRTRSLAEGEALRLHQAPDPGDREETVRDYTTRWLVRVQPRLRSGSYEMYRWAIAGHVVPALGDLKLVHLRQAQVKDFLSAKLASGLEKKSVRNIKQALHACLAEAADDKLIASNPASFRKGAMKWLQTSKAERQVQGEGVRCGAATAVAPGGARRATSVRPDAADHGNDGASSRGGARASMG